MSDPGAPARGAGQATVAALRAGSPGRPDWPVNDSKDCDAITAIAPVGLMPEGVDVAPRAMAVAALTHGHDIAQFAAGAVAIVIHRLVARHALEAALGDALSWLLWARRGRASRASTATPSRPTRRCVRSRWGMARREPSRVAPGGRRGSRPAMGRRLRSSMRSSGA